MPGIDITGKANIEATVTTKWDDNSFQKQTEQYPPFQEMQNEQGAENLQSLNETINNNTDSFKGNTAIMKEFGDVMPDIINSLRHMNSVVAQTASSLPAIKKTFTDEEKRKAQLDEYRRKNFFGLLDIGNGTINSLSSGNVGGAGIGLVSGAGNTVSNLSNMAKVKDLEGLSKGLLATSGVLLAGAALAKGGKALADSYKEAMPTIFGTGKAFGTTDDAESMRLYKTVNRYNRDTGLDIESFNTVVQSLRKQGIGNEYKNRNNQAIAASQIAETTAQWAYATGGDANQYANLAGVMSRYGGSKNVAEDFNYLVAAGKASGLNDVQIPEFLSGIQKVMEDGIAKGFTRSSTEVAQTLTMFSKMSGNSAFWQGEKGAQMLNQMNQGVAGATSLSKTSDILTYQAFRNAYSGTIKDENGNEISKIQSALKYGKEDSTYIEGGGYVNMMQLIEQGVNANNFGSIMEAAKNASGGDVNAETEFLRDIFGLNYTGVGKLKNLDLTGMTKDEADKAIKDALADPKNQNKETAWQTSLNQIAEALQSGGEKLFALELKGVNEIARDVNKIANWVTKGKNTKEDAAQDNPVSNESPLEGVLRDKGELTDEFIEKKEAVSEKARENFNYAQNVLLNDYTKHTYVNDPTGEQFETAYDYVQNYDSTQDLWKQSWNPVIEKRTRGIGLTANARQKDLEKNPYELASSASEKDVDPLTLILSLPETHEKYKSLLAGGKITPSDFMNAIATSEDAKKAVRDSTGMFDKQYSTKDLANINAVLEKIFSELSSGITVTTSVNGTN